MSKVVSAKTNGGWRARDGCFMSRFNGSSMDFRVRLGAILDGRCTKACARFRKRDFSADGSFCTVVENKHASGDGNILGRRSRNESMSRRRKAGPLQRA